jgi:asparaginyl-tRNA synthetase
LSQSGQLYNEAIAMAVGKTYCFGPTFRAEKSKTRRHLIEFWMIEPEVAYHELDDTIDLAENLICAIIESVVERRRIELDVLERDVSKLESVTKPFHRMTYDEAAAKLKAEGTDFTFGDDFGALDETALTDELDRPLVVTHYPSSIKAFYMQPDADRPDRALCVDILAPEGYGEIVGGGQRIHDPELLEKRLNEHELPRNEFQWYLDLRRYGSVPHSGFGMGIERFVSWICKLEHLREAIPFPRMLYRLTP